MPEAKSSGPVSSALNSRLTRRQTLQGAAALSLAPTLTSSRAHAQDRTHVTAMGVTVDPQRGLELWDIWKEEIETLHPDIEVEFITPIPGINTEKLLTMVATGGAPDVIQGSTLEYAARGLVIDLTDFIERDNILEDRPYFQKAIDAVQYNGRFYSMPGGLSTYVFWVNLDEMEAAGYEYPENGILTSDQFVEIAKKMTVLESGGEAEKWGYATSPWFSRMPPLIWARGGDLFEYDETTGFAVRSTFNTDPVIEAIQWNADLILEHQVSPENADAAEQAGYSFFSGNVGFNYGGNWLVSDGRQNIAGAFRWAPLRVPVMNEGDEPMEMVPAFNRGSILSSAEDREAAWKVLKYISGPEANELYREYVTDELIYDTPEFRERFVEGEEPENAGLILEVAEAAGQRPAYKSEVRVLYGWAQMLNIMSNELAAVYEGDRTAAEVAPGIEEQLNAILEEGVAGGFDPASPPDALVAP